MRLIASIIESMTNLKQRDADWIEDPYLFNQVAKSIFAVLEAIRPEGDLPSTVEDALDHGGRLQWKWRAAETLRGVKVADPALPLDEKSKDKRLASKLKADLGTLIDRVDTGHRNVPGTTMDILDEDWPTRRVESERPHPAPWRKHLAPQVRCRPEPGNRQALNPI